jgi:uncharacterized protein
MKSKHNILILVYLFISFWLTSMPVSAADLAQVKAAGLVGELLNGSLGLVNPNAAGDVKALVNSINAQRQAEYQRIAAKNGVPAEEVARLTAQKVINQTPAGQYVQTPAGWQRR